MTLEGLLNQSLYELGFIVIMDWLLTEFPLDLHRKFIVTGGGVTRMCTEIAHVSFFGVGGAVTGMCTGVCVEK